MIDKGLVSIIIPIFNTEKYLRRCLESVKNQTYKTIEIIMVDDGSADNSSEICKEYCESDNRFRYYYKQNGGPGSARNFGLKKSKGRYICYIDSDDWLEEDYTEYLISGFRDTDTDVVCCNKMVDGIIENKVIDEMVIEKNNLYREYVRGNILNSCCIKMFKREICEKISFFEKKNCFEDMIYTVDSLEHIRKMAVLEEAKYNLTIRLDSLSHSVAVYEKQSARLYSKIYVIKNIEDKVEKSSDFIKMIVEVAIEALESRINFTLYNVEDDILKLMNAYKERIRVYVGCDKVKSYGVEAIYDTGSLKQSRRAYLRFALFAPGTMSYDSRKKLLKRQLAQIIYG